MRKIKTLEDRFWSKVDQTSGCGNWTAATSSSGYGLIGRGSRGAGLVRASHVSWMIHNGDVPPGMWILHHCDNPLCVRPDHLFLGNHQDNMNDMISKGRDHKNPNYGEDHPSTKLSDTQITEIVDAWHDAPPRRHGRVAFRNALCAKYGVSDTTIKGVVGGYARRSRVG